MYMIKSLLIGRQIIFCREYTCTASEYSLMVYLDLFLSTVSTKTCVTSFLTSEKTTPYLHTQLVSSNLCTTKPWFRVLLYVTSNFFGTPCTISSSQLQKKKWICTHWYHLFRHCYYWQWIRFSPNLYWFAYKVLWCINHGKRPTIVNTLWDGDENHSLQSQMKMQDVS